jgi:phosphopantetheine--protein transferase-like protein
MTIIGVGLDAVELDRMRTVLARTPRLAERVFTEDERAYCEARRDPTERFAARFAAKEAVLKVLGEGILRVPLRDIEVVRAPSGKPSVELSGVAAERAGALGITTWQLSLTHTEVTATALAVGLHEAMVPQGDIAAHYASRDRKRNGAGALFRDAGGRLLLVKPTYREGWLIPGGAVEAGESPRQGGEREVHEELGLRRRLGRLLAVDWIPDDGVRGEAVHHLFDGGTLGEDEIGAIVLPPDELSAHAFVPVEEVDALLGPRDLARRLAAVLAAPPGTVVVLDDGVVRDGGPGPAPD